MCSARLTTDSLFLLTTEERRRENVESKKVQHQPLDGVAGQCSVYEMMIWSSYQPN